MNNSNEPNEIVKEISILYELSLSIGKSLDLKENCDAFLKTLMSRKNLAYAAIWIKNGYLPDEKTRSATLAYANPEFRIDKRSLPLGHPMFSLLEGNDAISINSSDDRFSQIITEKGVASGSFTIFKLGELGLLKLFSITRETAFEARELNQLRNVVSKFSFSLRGCLAHARVVEEIAERKRAEAEKNILEARLRQAQKMESLGTLAGGIAHDFNNILTSIIGFTQLAQYDLLSESPAQSSLAEVLKASDRAKDLVTQILAFSRQSEQEKIPLQIGPLVKETIKFIRSSVPTTIDIRHEIRKDLGTVLADATQIHQVLMNLCTNAAQAIGKKGGVIEVCVEEANIETDAAANHPDLKPHPYVKLTVRDTGQGMGRAVMERIFDPFFTTKKQGEGTGMGLSVVHGIVKSHEGAITVDSKPGKGTVFEVFLPMSRTEATSEAIASGPLPTGNERILFVDDEQPIAEMGKQMLERLGYHVTARTSSVDALESFRARPQGFDLVITDYTMPNMTGAELSKELLRVRPDIPIILCTGFSEAFSKRNAGAMGIREHIMKPVVMHDLAEMVRKVL
jgi:signal transduction histidine kinase